MKKLFIPSDIFDEMVAHCKAGYPNEACGILAGKNHEISKIYRMVNSKSSTDLYAMDSKEQFAVMRDIREQGLSMVSIFHSHPDAKAYPSQTDVKLAFYDDAVYIIVSLTEKEPEVKAFLITEGTINEVGIVIQDVHAGFRKSD